MEGNTAALDTHSTVLERNTVNNNGTDWNGANDAYSYSYDSTYDGSNSVYSGSAFVLLLHNLPLMCALVAFTAAQVMKVRRSSVHL